MYLRGRAVREISEESTWGRTGSRYVTLRRGLVIFARRNAPVIYFVAVQLLV